jgi:Cathepsin propeptide inhibitor domain (I29)
MKLSVAAVLLVLLQQPAAGFVPVQNAFAQRRLSATLRMEADQADVSIPYDAAARLAYEQWRAEFGKGEWPFEAARFKTFKDNYEIVTIANVKAKKKARDEGTVSLSLMSLNEFGDMTQEEFEWLMGMGAQPQQQEYKENDDDPSIEAPPAQPTTTIDMLGKAFEAVELQTEASIALEEASDALAVEEQVRGIE